jgi:hypothetical protein
MSRSELTDAYVSGRISRRSFVRGMVALGASVPVAMALADKVSAAPGAAGRLSRSSDVYPDPYPHPPKPPKPPKPHDPKPAPVTVSSLPATGVAQQDTSSMVAPLAAGAAAAALVALRMRQPKNTEGES